MYALNTNLGTEKISKLLWTLSVPAVMGMLSGAILNVIDRIFVGSVNEYALTAVGITMPLQILQMAFVLLIGVGSASLISIKLGEGKPEMANDILFLAFKYIFISLIGFSIVFLIFLDPILSFMQIPQNAYSMAKEYIVIIVVGGIIGLPGYCLSSPLRAVGKASVTMKIIIITTVLNIVLNPIFITTLNLGVAGAAIATVISQAVLTIYIIYYFAKAKNLPAKLHFKKSGNNTKGLLFEIVKVGSPSFYVQIFATAVNTYVNIQIVAYGTDLDIGAFTIASTIFSVYNMLVNGIAQGNQPICGFNFGAKKYDRVYQSLKLSLIYSFIISIALFAICMFIPYILVRPFADSPLLIEAGITATRWYMLMIPLMGLQLISSQYFQSIGKTKLTTLLMLLRYGLLLAPFVAIFAPLMDITGIYLSYAASNFIAAAIAIFYIIKELFRLKKMPKEAL